MNFGIYTSNGRSRIINEDFVVADHPVGIYIVCDGMGGHAAGDFASIEAANFILTKLKCQLMPEYDDQQVVGILKKTLQDANRHIFNLSKTKGEYKEMGTTALVAYFKKQRLYICHVGDSRAYLINQSGADLMTKDHSYVQQLVDCGEITAAQAKVHPGRNMITQAIGSDANINPEIVVCEFDLKDILLLCSDGLSEGLSKDDIFSIITCSENYQEAAKSLVEQSFKNGSNDDASAIVIGYQEIKDTFKGEVK